MAILSLYRFTAKTKLGIFTAESVTDLKYAIIVQDDWLKTPPEVFVWVDDLASAKEGLLMAMAAGRPYERTVLLAPVTGKKWLRDP